MGEGNKLKPHSREDAQLTGHNDETLLKLVAGGDYAAFTELYERFNRVAYGLALRVIVDRQLAEDAFAESMLVVFRTAPSFDPRRGSARTWILTIVHRRAVDLVRRENRHRTSELIEQSEAHGPTAEETAELRGERELVQGALRRLPERERRLIELAYYGGYTQSDLASSLDLSLGTVKSRMFTGLARMREFLPADPRLPALSQPAREVSAA
jgi:RNA polymerase sigma factor (sigma-70 family)